MRVHRLPRRRPARDNEPQPGAAAVTPSRRGPPATLVDLAPAPPRIQPVAGGQSGSIGNAVTGLVTARRHRLGRLFEAMSSPRRRAH
jgi:hypothetical protein